MESAVDGEEYHGRREISSVNKIEGPCIEGTPPGEYRAAIERVAVFNRRDRGLIQVSGADRLMWLNNLVTNDVRTLLENTGCYAFALDARGRIRFDLNIFDLGDVLLLDVDRAAVVRAIEHLSSYIIMEEVRIEDASADYARIGCAGPCAGVLSTELGISDFDAMPLLAIRRLAGGSLLFRSGFAGLPGFELAIPSDQASALLKRLVEAGAAPAGAATLEVLRIEAGIPWLGRDLDETVLPPETGRIARGVSYTKGCYLGQEILERMRSRGSLGRRLVRLRLARGGELMLPAAICREGIEVGRLTSAACHPLSGEWIGLGYLRTTVEDARGLTVGAAAIAVDSVEPV